MRVALVCHGLPPDRRTGVETHAAALARALVRLGHDVVTIAPECAPERPHLSVRELVAEEPGHARAWRINLVHAPRSTVERDEPPGLQAVFRHLWERERPDVVHIENAFGFGLEPFTSAQTASLPTVASAHDYAPVCHRVTLVRPDLERCTSLADPAACGRCDAGTAVLDAHERLGDYQLGALPDQLEADERAALALALTRDDANRTAERSAFARARRAAWNACDRILVPSRYLYERCVEGGIDPARLRRFEFGSEIAELARLAVPERAPDEPLRVLFIGGLSKHKGVHLLVDAALRAKGAVELTIAGSSSDEPYRTELVRRASGRVRFRGAFDRAELAHLLADAHVVAVPSVWVENAPFVVREAFAARRPVLASRLGALPESLQDGRDGLLIEPTLAAWGGAFDELERDRDLLARLVEGIQPPRTIDDEARELVELYAQLNDPRDPVEHLPASVQPFARELARLDGLTEREVVARALQEVDRQRRDAGFSDEDFVAQATSVVVAELGRLSGDLRAAVREIEWLRTTLEQADERDRWRVQVERDARAEASALRAELEHERERSAAHAAEAGWWRARAQAAEAQARELEAAGAAARDEGLWRRRELAGVREIVAAIEQERSWLNETLQAARSELEWRRSESESLSSSLAALTRHEHWLRSELQGLVQLGDPVSQAPEPPEAHDLPALLARLAARLGGGGPE